MMDTAISLLTDFGTKDPFVAEMKAVIFSTCPAVRVIDITHEVERFNIRMGAFLLADTAPYFPQGTIHVAVVDPGVGSERRPILVETLRSLFVGPDNGLLVPAASRENIQHVFNLTNRSLMRKEVSSTFHGRDIFAPIAAHLASGRLPAEVGEKITDYVRMPMTEPVFDRRGARCEVLYVDGFGNAIINITGQHLEKLSSIRKQSLRVRGRQFPLRLVRTYSDLRVKEFGLLLGSHGYLEVTCREASAARRLKVRTGDALRVEGA